MDNGKEKTTSEHHHDFLVLPALLMGMGTELANPKTHDTIFRLTVLRNCFEFKTVNDGTLLTSMDGAGGDKRHAIVNAPSIQGNRWA